MKELFITREYKSAQDIDGDFWGEPDLNIRSGSINQGGDKFLGKHLSDKRINVFLVLVFLTIVLVFARAVHLQIINGPYFGHLAEINRTREKPLPASRGLIYDRNNVPLVKNIPIFDALILPKDLSLNEDNRVEQIKQIANLLKIDESSVVEILKKHPKNFNYYLTVKDNIDYDTALILKIQASQFPGLYIETRNQRQYLYPNEFAHLFGYLGKITEKELANEKNSQYLYTDYIGKTGLELFYEESLRGKYGKEQVEVDVQGRETKVLSRQEPQSGDNLILTIDEAVQKKVREILQKKLSQLNKKRGVVILLNPQNGEIIAMVSLPDYDNNLFSGSISSDEYKKLIEDENNPLFDRAIKGEYPAGSTIKPVISAAALNEGIISANTTFLSTGGIWVDDRWFFPDWSAAGHGITNVYRAIAWSVNTFFYIIGGGYKDFEGLGVDRLEKYFLLFGLNVKTGIDLSGESSGLVPSPEWKIATKNEDWYIGDTYHISIGQGDLLVTPLQMADYTSFFANQGKIYVPHLVKEKISADNKVVTISPKIIRENFIAAEDIDIVKKAMRQTVTIGSAQSLNNLSVSVAGKTGTAQWSSEKATHAWFTGFAPYENPEVVVTVLVEEGGEGSAVSVPIAGEILDWYFNVYQKKD